MMTGYTDFPLAPGQNQVLASGATGFAHQHALAFEITGSLDVERLRSAVATLFELHEPLRTCFPIVDGVCLQRIAVDFVAALDVVDMSARNRADVQAYVRSLVKLPMAVDSGPLARFVLLRLRQNRHVIALIMHVLVADAWSWRILLKNLSSAYAGELLQPLELQCADWAAWRFEAASAVPEEETRRWRRTLESTAGRNLYVQAGMRRGVRKTVELQPDSVAAVRTLMSLGATGFTVFASAFALLWSERSGAKQIVFQTPVSDREDARLDRAMGFFVDLLPVVVTLPGDCSTGSLLNRVRTALAESTGSRDAALAAARRLSGTPVHFAFRSAALRPELSLPGCAVVELDVSVHATKFGLGIIVDETPSGFTILAEFDASIVNKRWVTRLLEDYEETVRKICLAAQGDDESEAVQM